MIDLETLGQEPGSVILSISAVQFDIRTGETGKQFDEVIGLESSLKQGLKIDPVTLAFWTKIPNRLNYFLTYQGRVSLSTALGNFGKWLNILDESPENLCFGASNYDVTMWGRGPRFDFGLLSYAYNSVGYPSMPWDFRKERCVRTMEMFYPDIKKQADNDRLTMPHNGIDDCKHQILYVSEIYNKIKSK
jgi:exodeoxyribonuclease VIII